MPATPPGHSHAKAQALQRRVAELGESNAALRADAEHQSRRSTSKIDRSAAEKISLEELVNILGERCPWTQTIEAERMLDYLASEVVEVRDELALLETGRRCGGSGSISSGAGSRGGAAAALEAEFGDVFFDVLLLGNVLERNLGTDTFSVSRAKQRAVRKMQGRCSYIWGDDVAHTAADCEAIFAQRKAEQKACTPKAHRPADVALLPSMSGGLDSVVTSRDDSGEGGSRKEGASISDTVFERRDRASRDGPADRIQFI